MPRVSTDAARDAGPDVQKASVRSLEARGEAIEPGRDAPECVHEAFSRLSSTLEHRGIGVGPSGGTLRSLEEVVVELPEVTDLADERSELCGRSSLERALSAGLSQEVVDVRPQRRMEGLSRRPRLELGPEDGQGGCGGAQLRHEVAQCFDAHVFFSPFARLYARRARPSSRAGRNGSFPKRKQCNLQPWTACR